MMDLVAFISWALAQGSVGRYQDGSFLGECVSLINQYCWRVLGVPAGSWGNAKDWATNPTVLAYFNKVSTPTPGCILVYGATKTNEYGHIELYIGNNQSLYQNRSYNGRVGRGTTLGGAIAILQPKNAAVGGEDKGIMNDEDAKEGYRGLLHREPENDQVWRAWVGKRFSDMSKAFRGSTEWLTQNHAIAFFGQREQQLNEAFAQVSDANARLAAALQDDAMDKAAVQAAKDQVVDALKKLDEVTTNFNGVKQKLDQLEAEKEQATATGNLFLRWLGEQLNKIPGINIKL